MTATAPSALFFAADPITPSGSDSHLTIATLAGIAVIIVLITWLEVHLVIGLVGVLVQHIFI